MIRITDSEGTDHYVAPANIARVVVAGTSSQWHGIRSIVKMFDGATIEAQQEAQAIADQVDAASTGGPPGG